MKANTILFCGLLAATTPASAGVVARFPMDIKNGMITETVSGNQFAVEGHFAPESVAGA